MQGLVVCTIQILTFFFSAVNMQRILTPRDQCFTNTIRNIFFFKKTKFVCITMLCKNVVIFTSLSQYNCWKLNILCTYISFFKKFRQNDVEFFSPWNQSKLMKKHNNKEIQPKNNLVVKPPQSIWCNHDHLFSPKRIFKIHVLLLCSCHRCLEYFLN